MILHFTLYIGKHKLSPDTTYILISSNAHETFKHIRLSRGTRQRRAGFAWKTKPGQPGPFVRTSGRLSNVFLRRLVGIGSDKLAGPTKTFVELSTFLYVHLHAVTRDATFSF